MHIPTVCCQVPYYLFYHLLPSFIMYIINIITYANIFYIYNIKSVILIIFVLLGEISLQNEFSSLMTRDGRDKVHTILSLDKEVQSDKI